jgi:hypothetical protein
VQDFLKAAVRPEVLGPDVGLLVRGSDLEELRGARMEQIAAPDSAYLTEHTAKLVEGLIQLQDLGKLAVKGVKEPLGVYALQGIGRLHTKIEVSRARGFSKFVENVHQDVQVGRAEREIVVVIRLEIPEGHARRLISVDSDETVGKTDSGAYSSASRRASVHPPRGESKRTRDQAFRLRSSDFRQSRAVIHSGLCRSVIIGLPSRAGRPSPSWPIWTVRSSRSRRRPMVSALVRSCSHF